MNLSTVYPGKTGPAVTSGTSRLRVGFLLIPRFTLTAFAGFVDALRLAADEGDRSAQRNCQWEILGAEPVASSCGAVVSPTRDPDSALDFDYLVVVGGLLHGGQRVPVWIRTALAQGAARGVRLVGLCTGSFVLARLGLMQGHVACVSWFHRKEFEAEFPACRVISNQMFVVDRDRLTCAGGTGVVHLAASLIERHIGRAHAVKALRIMLEEQPLPARTLQPAEVLSEPSRDTLVHKAMLILEQQGDEGGSIDAISARLGISRRQLERRFRADIGLSPADYRQRLRLERGRWLLTHTDLGVIDIALECGFQDAASFARAVRRAWGMSPSVVRAAGGAHATSLPDDEPA